MVLVLGLLLIDEWESVMKGDYTRVWFVGWRL